MSPLVDCGKPSGTPLVSIITLTYNHEAFLPQCIESILGQTFSSWEQVIIDDESTDGTIQVLARYSDPRLRTIRQAHQGAERLPQSYQKALAMCRGRFIGFLDGDDYWPVDKLERLLPAFDDPDIVLAFGPTQVVGNASSDYPPTIPSPAFYQQFSRDVLFNTPVGAATRAMLDPSALTFPYPVSVLLRRSTLDRIGGLVTYPGLPVMDYPTLLHLTLEGRFHYVDRTMGFWRVHGRSVTSQRLDAIQAGVYRFIQEFRRIQAPRLDLTPDEWRALERKWADHHLGFGMRSLREHRWKNARSYFLRAVRRGAGRGFRAHALAGIAASLAHRELDRDLQRIVRARQWILRTRVARLLGRT